MLIETENLDTHSFAQVVTIGEQFGSMNASEWQPKFKQAVELGSGSLLLDMRTTNFIDSQGISLLVALFKECSSADRELSVAIGTKMVKNICTTMHLHRHITFLDCTGTA